MGQCGSHRSGYSGQLQGNAQAHTPPPPLCCGRARGTLHECHQPLPQPCLIPTLGDRGLDAENSEGTPVLGQTAPGAQAADGSGPWGAVSN